VTVDLIVNNPYGTQQTLSSTLLSIEAGPGLYISNIINFNSAIVSNATVNAANGYLNLNINNTTNQVPAGPASQTILVTFQIGASCVSFPIGSTSATVSPSLFDLSSGTSVSIQLSGNTAINATEYAYLTQSASSNYSTSSQSNYGQIVSRTYILTNSSSNIYSGYLQFSESLGSALTVSEVMITINATVTNTFLNTAIPNTNIPANSLFATKILTTDGNSLNDGNPIPISVPAGGTVTISENIYISGCLEGSNSQGVQNGSSTALIQWGAQTNAVCNQWLASANISYNPGVPSLTIDLSKSNYAPELSCVGTPPSQVQKKYVSWKYNGDAPAQNVVITLQPEEFPNTLITRNPGDITVQITRANSTTPEFYTVNESANDICPGYSTLPATTTINSTTPNLPGPIVEYLNLLPTASENIRTLAASIYSDVNYKYHPFLYDQNGIGLYNIYMSISDWEAQGWGGQFKSYGPKYNTTSDLFVLNYVISSLIPNPPNSTGGITLYPGDEIQVSWNEFTPCNFEDIPVTIDMRNSMVQIKYSDECGHNLNGDFVKPQIYNSNYQVSSELSAGDDNLTGDMDHCSKTSDGQIGNVSIDYNVISWVTLAPASDNTTDTNPLQGKLLFKLYLDDGLDLDLSLTTPKQWGEVSQSGYNNLTGQSTGCDNSCTNTGCNLQNVLPNPYYNVVFTLNNNCVDPKANNAACTKINIATGSTGNGSITQQSDQMHSGGIPYRIGDPNSPQTFVTRNAAFLYTFSVNINDIATAIGETSTDPAIIWADIRKALNGSNLSFDIRSYCPNTMNGPSTWKLEMLYDRCLSTNICGSDAFATTYFPLCSNSNTISVNCPGCKTPGTNIAGSLYRQNMGFPDVNPDDGIADQTVTPLPNTSPNAKLATTGDIMTALLIITMSDGQGYTTPGNPAKCTFNDLVTRNYYLDNLYVAFPNSGPNMTLIGATASLNGGTFINVGSNNIITQQDGSFMIRIPASLLGAMISNGTINSFSPSSAVSILANFSVGIPAATSQNIQFNYSAGYSACDDCSSFGIIGQTSMLDATTINPFDLNAITGSAYQPTYWWCTNFGNEFTFIPYWLDSQLFIGDNNNPISTDPDQSSTDLCKKVFTANVEGRFYTSNDPANNPNMDAFPGEYRSFLSTSVPLINQFPIPAGYSVTTIDVISNYNHGTLYGIQDEYVIQDQKLISQWISPNYITGQTVNKDFPNILTVKLNSQNNNGNPIAYTQPPFQPYGTGYEEFNTLGENRATVLTASSKTPQIYFTIRDENFSYTIYVGLSQNSCSGIVNQMYNGNQVLNLIPEYSNGIFTPLSNIQLSSNQSGSYVPAQINSPEYNPTLLSCSSSLFCLSNTAQYTIPGVYTYYEPYAILTKPNPPLTVQSTLPISTTTNQAAIPITNKYLQVPISITNTSTTQDAGYPYLYVNGSSLTKGLSLVGVFQGTTALTSIDPNNLPGFYQFTQTHIPSGGTYPDSYIIGMDQTNLSTSATNGYFKITPGQTLNVILLFSYDCSITKCNPYEQCSNSTSTSSTGCLTNDALNIVYGWNCGLYPTFDQLTNSTNPPCGMYPPLTYSLVNSLVGLSATGTLAQSANSCTDYTYTVDMVSCQPGSLDNFNVTINLPPNWSISGNAGVSLSTLNVTNTGASYLISSKDGNGLTSQNGHFQLNIPLQATCGFNLTDQITTTVSATSFCNSSIVPITITSPVDIFPASDLTIQSVNLDQKTSTFQVTIASVSNAAVVGIIESLNVSFPAGITSNGASSSLVSIPLNQALPYVVKIPITMATNINFCGSPIQSQLQYPFCSSDKTCTAISSTLNYNVNSSFTASISAPSTSCYNGNTTLTALTNPVLTGVISYQWYNNGVSMIGETGSQLNLSASSSIAAYISGKYSVVVTYGGCSSIAPGVLMNAGPSVLLSVPSSTGASLLCDGGSVLLNATATAAAGNSITQYSWTYEIGDGKGGFGSPSNLQSGPTLNSYTVQSPATGVLLDNEYIVTVTDNNGCTATTEGEVTNYLNSTCVGDICPGSPLNIQVLNAHGIIGNYGIQLYQVTGTPTSPSYVLVNNNTPSVAGNYVAAYVPILPNNVAVRCTLFTKICPVTFLPTPNPYVLSVSGGINHCVGDNITVSIQNPLANYSPGAGREYTLLWSYTGSSNITGSTSSDLNQINGVSSINYSAGVGGGVELQVTDIVSTCKVNSSTYINIPSVSIGWSCSSQANSTGNTVNTIKLDAVLSVSGISTYSWSVQDLTLNNTVTQITNQTDPTTLPYITNSGATLIVPQSTGDTYNYTVIVTNAGILCGTTTAGGTVSQSFQVVPDPGSSGIVSYNKNMLSTNLSSFVVNPKNGSTFDCSKDVPSFTTDFNCWDINSATQFGYDALPGHYIINLSPEQISGWNINNGQSLWGGSAIAGDEGDFLIADGFPNATTNKMIWGTTVTVQSGVRYRFVTSIMNIDFPVMVPPRAIPEIFLQITSASGSNATVLMTSIDYSIYASTTSSPAWMDINGEWLSNINGPVVISVMMKPGSFNGNDIALDQISFVPYDRCQIISQAIATQNPPVRIRECAAIAEVERQDLVTCQGIPVTFTIPLNVYNSNMKYNWYLYDPNNAITTGTSLDSDNNQFFTVSPASNQSYALVVTDPVNQCQTQIVVDVYIIQPSISITSTSVNVCLNPTITFSANGFAGLAGVSYQWQINNNNVATNSIGIFTSSSLKNNDVVTCQLLNTCQNTGTLTSNSITILGATGSVSAGASTAICYGNSAQLNASGGTGYVWSPTIGLSSGTIANPLASPTLNTNYSVTAIDANGCAETASINVVVNPLPIVSTGNSGMICSGSSIQLNASGASTYQWNSSTSLSALNISNPIASPVSTTSYTVSGTDKNGCIGTSEVIITVQPLPVVSVNNGNAEFICDGNSVQLNASTTATVSNSWSWSSSSSLSSLIISNPIATPTSTQNYSVTNTADYGGVKCSGSGSSTVNVVEAPILILNGKNLSVSAPVPVGIAISQFSWYKNNFLLGTTNGTTTSYPVSGNGNYSVVVSYFTTGIINCTLQSNILNVSTTAITGFVEEDVRIYPIPTQNSLIIETQGTLLFSQYKIIDMLGKEVAFGKLNDNCQSIDVSSLSSAIYVLILTNDDGKFYNKNIEIIK